MAIAGSVRPSEPATEDEFRRIFALIAPSYRRPLPAPFGHGPLRVAQTSAFVPAATATEPESGVSCWVEGRAYNLDALRARHGLPDAVTFPRLLAAAQERGTLSSVLRDVNGEFFAVLYDARVGALRLCSDRLGLKPAYFLARGPEIFFCSRLRGALALQDFSPTIAPEAVACYLDLGHLLGDFTWFEGVELLSPATVLTVDVATGALARERYWRWREIPRLSIAPAESEELAGELARRLRAAVERQVLPGEKPLVMLSGGLDSRALLACLPSDRCGGTATMGQRGCRDLDYAVRVARAAGVSHRELSLTVGNWDLNRFHALWKCDAMVSPSDLTSSQFSREMRELGVVNLNGFAGDLVAGGSYLREGFLNVPAGSAFAELQYGSHAVLALGADDHSRSAHTDPYVLAQRVRRMTLAGTLEAEDASEQRKPFMDNDLLEFLYGLPDGVRLRSMLYRRALRILRPDLFQDIPWQKTGMRIDAEDSAWGRTGILMLRAAQRFGIAHRPAGFQNLGSWLRASAPKYDALLSGSGVLWPAFVDASRRPRFDFAARLREGDAQGLLRAVGLEVWLQQVFNARHREPDVPEPEAL